VNNANSALLGQGNRERSFSNGVHCGRTKRYLKPNVSCELRRSISLVWQNVGSIRNQENVVEGQTFQYFLGNHFEISSSLKKLLKVNLLKSRTARLLSGQFTVFIRRTPSSVAPESTDKQLMGKSYCKTAS
jgi:hypothetical protein